MAVLVATANAEQWDKQPEEEIGEYFQRTEDLLEAMEAAVQKIPTGVVKGRLLYFPVADGAAIYRVVKEKPLQIEHIPFGDAYRIPAAYVRGINIDDVRAQVGEGEDIDRLMREGEGKGLIPRESGAIKPKLAALMAGTGRQV